MAAASHHPRTGEFPATSVGALFSASAVSSRAVVIKIHHRIDAGQQLTPRTLQIDLIVHELDFPLRQFRAGTQGLGHHVLDRRDGLGLRYLDGIGWNDAGFGNRRASHPIAAQRVFENYEVRDFTE